MTGQISSSISLLVGLHIISDLIKVDSDFTLNYIIKILIDVTSSSLEH